MRFVIGYDKLSYYIKCGYGNATHFSHLNATYNNESFAPSSLMNKSQQSLIRLGDRAKTRISTDIDYVNASGNFNFSRHQVHHLKRLVKQVRQLDGVESGGTDTDQLLHYFESMEDCRYTILYNNPINLAGSDDSNLLTNYLRDSCVGSEVYSSTVQYTSDELS